MTRVGEVGRETRETSVKLRLDLDGTGKTSIATGVGFFDHMLDQLARHALIDLEVEATGDLHVDSHHTVEDVGICLGQALTQALGTKAGIRRYGWSLVPMEESLVQVSLDLSGRPLLVYDAPVSAEAIGTYDPELTEEFFMAFSRNAGMTLHIKLQYGKNSHHIIEGVFKSTSQALAAAIQVDPRRGEAIPSTKGSL